MTTDTAPAATIPPPTRQQASQIFDAEVTAFGLLIDKLSGNDWEQPTTSGDWQVRDIVAHTCGQLEEMARFDVLLRRLWVTRRRYPERIVLDGHNQIQLDDVADLTPNEIVNRFRRYGPAGVRASRRMPFFVRSMPSEWFFPGSPLPEPTMGFLLDVVATRDTWMHRVEITRATDHPMTLTEHDKAVVAQVVRDLGLAWSGPAVNLELTGDAGATWVLGRGSQTAAVSADAVEMMLHLSGRPAVGIDAVGPVGSARVVF
jgi:uncharacterized protein (TIGR03083 family)